MITATGARDSVAAAIRRGLARPERLSGSAWAERHRKIVDKYAAQKGPWRNDRVPYLREVMDAFADPRVRKVAVMKAEQLGGTEALLNYLLRSVHQDPGPTIWVWPTEDAAANFCRQRAIPTFKACAAVATHFTERKQDVQTLRITFDRMSLDFAGSNSDIALESFPRRDVIIDELDRCPEHIVAAVIGRMTTFDGREKLLLNGRPENEDEGIDKAYKEGDRREYMVPCPRCGEYHIRRFRPHVRWEGGLDADPEVVKRTAWFRCPACERPIHAHENLWQLQRGVWCPEGMSVTRCIDGVAGTLIGQKAHPTAYPSFFIRGLLNPFVANPYGGPAAEFVQNKGQALRAWVTRRLGEPWSERGKRIEPSALRKLCVQIEEGGYKRGVVPAEAAFVTCQADVQHDRLYIEFDAWDLAGGCWLVDHAELPRKEKDGLAQLWTDDAGMLRTFTRIGPGGEDLGQVPVAFGMVDSGHFTVEVYNAVRDKINGRWGPGGTGPKVFPSKGMPGYADTRQFFWGRPEKDDRGRPVRGSVWLFNLNTHVLKTECDDQLRAAESIRRARMARAMGRPVAEQDGEWIDRVAAWRFPEDTADEYFEQLVAEELKKKLDRGRTVWRWVTKRQDLPNHFLDCRVMGMGLSTWVRSKLRGDAMAGRGDGAASAAEAERREIRDDRWARLRDRIGRRVETHHTEPE